MVNSYRFLARAGVALLVLAAVCAVGFRVSGLRVPHARPAHLVAARPTAWGRYRQVWVARGGDGPALHILIVGASVSHGLGASTPARGYAPDLARMIEERTGRTVDEVVWSRPGARVAASDSWSLPADQQVVIVQLITNDFIHGTPLVRYQQDLTTLLDRVNTTSPRATLLCLGAWEPAYAVNHIGVPVAAYDTIERAGCAGHGGGYLSPSPIFQHAAWRGPKGRVTAFGRGDDFHPNNQGHLQLADAILANLRAQHALPSAVPPASTTLIKKTSTHRN